MNTFVPWGILEDQALQAQLQKVSDSHTEY